jgi:hypothetical protein
LWWPRSKTVSIAIHRLLRIEKQRGLRIPSQECQSRIVYKERRRRREAAKNQTHQPSIAIQWPLVARRGFGRRPSGSIRRCCSSPCLVSGARDARNIFLSLAAAMIKLINKTQNICDPHRQSQGEPTGWVVGSNLDGPGL